MTARRWYLFLTLPALVTGSGALSSATSEPHHGLSAYAEPVARLSQRDIYLRANRGQYASQQSHGFRPRVDVLPFPLKLPLDWGADPFDDRNWQFQLHAWRMIDPIIYEYFETGEVRFLQEAMTYMLDWWRFHEDDAAATRFSWYDMATGIRAMRLAMMIDLLRAQRLVVDPESTDDLLAMAESHIARLREPDFISRGNHGIFQIHGLRLLCAVTELMEVCNGEEDYSNGMMLELLNHQFTAEGVHKEDSPTYHFFATKLFGDLVDPKWYAIGDEVDERIHRAREVEPWLIFPNGELARFGDSDGSKKPAQFVARGERGCATLSAADACIRIGDFSSSGYAIVRSDWAVPAEQASMLFVSGMAYGSGHEHADELSFELFEFGQRIIVDSGKYGYEKNDFREYVRSLRAHNTVSLSEQHLGPAETGLTGSALFPVEAAEQAIVLSGQIRRGDALRHERELAYRPRAFLLITDHVWSGEEPFAVLFHVSHDLEAVPDDDAFIIRLNGGERARLEILEGECAGALIEGQRSPHLQGWESIGYLQMTPAPTIRFDCSPGERLVQTLISFGAGARTEALRLAGQRREAS